MREEHDQIASPPLLTSATRLWTDYLSIYWMPSVVAFCPPLLTSATTMWTDYLSIFWMPSVVAFSLPNPIGLHAAADQLQTSPWPIQKHAHTYICTIRDLRFFRALRDAVNNKLSWSVDLTLCMVRTILLLVCISIYCSVGARERERSMTYGEEYDCPLRIWTPRGQFFKILTGWMLYWFDSTSLFLIQTMTSFQLWTTHFQSFR